MKITAIKPQQKSEERASIFVDSEFRLGVALNLVEEMGLRVGTEWDESLEEQLRKKDVSWKAKNRALGLLASRARSAFEIRQRLRRKDYPEDAIDYALSELERLGYLDDRAFAEMFVRDRLNLRPRGSRLLMRELRAKGISEEIAKSVIEEALVANESSDSEVALELAKKWLARQKAPADAAARMKLERRLYGQLARKGFGGDAIQDSMKYFREWCRP